MSRTQPRRRHILAAGIYVLVSVLFAATMAPEQWTTHTPYNHYALLANAWIHGRLDLGGPPPAYTHNNDFAVYGGRTFISFPPFPAVLIAPVVALNGTVERTRDGLFFLGMAGIAPAVLFLALEKLSRTGRSARSQAENAALALLFAFGTVYWFSSVQGTVWFAAHVVGTALAAIYLYCSIGADHPVFAGFALALGFATRTPLGFAFPLFLFEAYRAAALTDPADGVTVAPRLGRADLRTLIDKFSLFFVPVSLVLAVLLWHNRARFGDPLEFGHRYLSVYWRTRIDKWGLFSYHYLARNLGVVLTSLPYIKGGGAPFQVNTHGLALWVTSPFFAWALWPRRTGSTFWGFAVTALAVAAPALFYQNTGWSQFGFRFSNDFAVFVMVLIAVGARRLSPPFWILGALAMVVNGFGAVTFERAPFARYYFVDGSQKILHQPD